jgi:hypothetical protein
MYTTIEADIKNGRITGPESQKLPAMAHVLITLLSRKVEEEPATSPQDGMGLMARFAGAWQGEALVREDQGAYEIRSELK